MFAKRAVRTARTYPGQRRQRLLLRFRRNGAVEARHPRVGWVVLARVRANESSQSWPNYSGAKTLLMPR